jgi:uncharacterized protein YyaL (SSP411 family)
MLDYHSFFIAAAIDLFEASGDERWIDEARALERVVAQHFEDTELGGFFTTPHDGEALLVREKATHDGSEPSGASIHALSLLRLATILDDQALRERGRKTIESVAQVLSRHPAALHEMLLAVDFIHAAPKEIVLVGGFPPPRDLFLPHAVVIQARTGTTLALAKNKNAVDGKPTAFVCERGSCQLPITDVSGLPAALLP